MTGHFLEIGLLSWLPEDTFAQCIFQDFEFGGVSIEFPLDNFHYQTNLCEMITAMCTILITVSSRFIGEEGVAVKYSKRMFLENKLK